MNFEYECSKIEFISFMNSNSFITCTSTFSFFILVFLHQVTHLAKRANLWLQSASVFTNLLALTCQLQKLFNFRHVRNVTHLAKRANLWLQSASVLTDRLALTCLLQKLRNILWQGSSKSEDESNKYV